MFTGSKRALGACAALLASASVAACGSTSGGSESESAAYPSGRLSIMAPADPGGGWDQTARALQQTIRDSKLGAGADVYNVPGAGGTLGLSQLASKEKGKDDQLMVMGLVMLGAVETNKSSVGLDSVTPIATLTEEAEAIVVKADSKYKTLDDLLSDLRADPSSIAWAGGSAGGTDQLLVGSLAKAVGADPAKTKYIAHSGGGEALTAILSGSVDAGVSGVAEFTEQVEGGKLRMLAVSGETGLDVGGTQVKSIAEQGVDVVMTNWRGIVAPPGLTDEQRGHVVDFVEKVRATPAWKANLERFGWASMDKSGSEFDSFLKSEQQRVQELVAELNLTGT
jgi:putative tricarboxylic transport membrane protein